MAFRRNDSLRTQVQQLSKRIDELEAQLSVVDGRSSMNANRVVRTHSSVQNLAEDVVDMHPQLRPAPDPAPAPLAEPEPVAEPEAVPAPQASPETQA